MKENIIIKWNPPEWWENEFYDELNKQETHHLVLLPQEVFPYQIFEKEFSRIDELLTNKRSKLTLYSGAPINHLDFKNITFSYWPSLVFFTDCFFRGKNNKYTKFCTLTMVKSGRQWRHYIYDKIQSSSIEKNSLIFNFEKEYNDKTISKHLNNDYETIWPYNHLQNFLSIEQMAIPWKYPLGIIDIVCETHLDYFFPTEKTIRPIIHRKPFLVVGCHNYHKDIENEFGIKRFDIFDYSFDEISNHQDRMDKYLDEINRIQNEYTIEEIIKNTNSIVNENYLQLQNIQDTIYYPIRLSNIFWSENEYD